MKPTEYRDRAHIEAKQQLAGLRLVKTESSCGGFQYGYLARLLDDRELSLIEDPQVRSAVRAAHRQVYWKSLRLLNRDVSRVLVNRRRLMDTRQEWRFESLVADSARVWQLLWTLRVAGVAHGIRLPLMLDAVREASAELGRLIAAPLTQNPAIHAA